MRLWQHSNFVKEKADTIKPNLTPAATALVLLLLLQTVASAEEFVWAPDIGVGDSLPSFSLPDDSGIIHESRLLPGSHGLLLFFNRSTDW